MKHFTILMILTVLLNGCARATPPTQTIVDEHIQLVNEILDYANNELSDTPDMDYMKNALKTCKAGLISANAACDAQIEAKDAKISACEAEKTKWKVITAAMGILLLAGIYLTIRRGIK